MTLSRDATANLSILSQQETGTDAGKGIRYRFRSRMMRLDAGERVSGKDVRYRSLLKEGRKMASVISALR